MELFAGAGGMALGFHRAGFHLVALAEIDPHACCVLRTRFPGVPLYGDVQQVDGREVVSSHGPVDLVTFGAPCQDLSVAGKREGLSGSRSSLFYDGIRIWEETGATYALYENVLGALNSQQGADFAAVLSAFVGRPVAVPRDGWTGGGGVVAGPAGVAAWRVLDAQFFGVPQRRRRVFVLGARPGGVDPAQVLLESDGVPWDSASSSEAGEGTADDASDGAGIGVVGSLDTECGFRIATFQSVLAGHVVPDDGIRAVMGTITARMNMSLGARDVEEGAVIVVPSLPASGAGTARTGNERTEAELVVVQVIDKQSGHVGVGDTPTLKTDLSHDMGPVVIGWDEELNAKAELMGSLKARKDGGGHEMGVLAFHENQRGEVRETPVFGSLAGGGGKPGQGYGAAVQAGRPRRLLPIETERLMGWDVLWTDVLHLSGSHKAACPEFPAVMREVEEEDDAGNVVIVEKLTRIPVVVSLDRPRVLSCCGAKLKETQMADSHRYKMCGNGVVSHVAEWIGRQLLYLETYPAS